MRWADLPLSPTDRTLRRFSGLFLIVFGGLALRRGLVRNQAVEAVVVGAVACAVGLIGTARPRWVRPLFVGWTVLTFPIGWAVSNLLLAAIYFGLVVPIGLVLRLRNRDVPRTEPESHWTPRPERSDPRGHLRPY